MPPTPPDRATWTGLTHDPLPVEAALAFLVPPDAHPAGGRVGGTCLFLGSTRRWTGSDETASLHYDAYRTMAERELARLAEIARERWALERIVALHRLGDVPAGEHSVLCAASAPHRAPAFEAARWLIDALKTDVPIWKREARADGTTAWVQPDTST